MIAVIVPWRPGCPHRAQAWRRVETHLRVTFGDVEIREADDGGVPFARGASVNDAVARSTADTIVICDADLIVPQELLRDAVTAARAATGVVIPFDRYLYLTRSQTDTIVAAVDLRLPARPVAEWVMAGSVGGCCALTRDTFDAAGGFDPRFRGWGCEDYAFDAASRTLAGPTRRLHGDAYHLWHPVDATNDPSRSGYQANAELMCRYVAATNDRSRMRDLIGER